MPTKEELIATKPAVGQSPSGQSSVTKLATDGEAAVQTLDSAIEALGQIGNDVKAGAGSFGDVGSMLRGLEWLPGAGDALGSLAGALAAGQDSGQSIAQMEDEAAKPLSEALGQAAQALIQVRNHVASVAEDAGSAHGETESAGEEFTSIQQQCEDGFAQLESRLVDVEGEVEESIVSAWNSLVDLFDSGHKRHTQRTTASAHMALEVQSRLSNGAEPLIQAAQAVRAALPPPPDKSLSSY